MKPAEIEALKEQVEAQVKLFDDPQKGRLWGDGYFKIMAAHYSDVEGRIDELRNDLIETFRQVNPRAPGANLAATEKNCDLLKEVMMLTLERMQTVTEPLVRTEVFWALYDLIEIAHKTIDQTSDLGASLGKPAKRKS